MAKELFNRTVFLIEAWEYKLSLFLETAERGQLLRRLDMDSANKSSPTYATETVYAKTNGST